MRDTRRVSGRASLSLALLVVALCSAALSACGSGPASGQPGVLTFALSEDPDPLDPTTSSTFVEPDRLRRHVREALRHRREARRSCRSWRPALPQVSKDRQDHDDPAAARASGSTTARRSTPQAVKTHARPLHHLKESSRAGDLASVDAVEVVDPYTVELHLKAPFAPLTALLADRAGMILSPTQLKKLGGASSARTRSASGRSSSPTASPATTSRSTSRRTTTTARRSTLERIVFKIITDGPVRPPTCAPGDVDVAERLEPVRRRLDQGRLEHQACQATTSLGYQGITINIGNKTGDRRSSSRARSTRRSAKHPELREAFEAALDRDAINKVVFYGQVTPDCGAALARQPVVRQGRCKCPGRDLAKAKQLVAEERGQDADPGQAPARVPTTRRPSASARSSRGWPRRPASTSSIAADRVHDRARPRRPGKFDAFLIGWSGRVDPDGNLSASSRASGAHELRRRRRTRRSTSALERGARRRRDTASARELYRAWSRRSAATATSIYLYHDKLFTGSRKDVTGVEVCPDGLPRRGVRRRRRRGRHLDDGLPPPPRRRRADRAVRGEHARLRRRPGAARRSGARARRARTGRRRRSRRSAHKYGLDKPLPVQYVDWIWPRRARRPRRRPPAPACASADTIVDRLPVTLELAFLACSWRSRSGIPPGVMAAVRRGRLADYVGHAAALRRACPCRTSGWG